MPAKPRIVGVIEDDPSVRTSIVRLLRAHGIYSEPYTSAELFLGALATTQANCLLIDVQLGRMSGLELQRRLKTSGSSLPVIFMTGVEDAATKNAAEEVGCIAFLHKPLAAKLLIETIAALVD
jgi:FixJ family two-component response regulator